MSPPLYFHIYFCFFRLTLSLESFEIYVCSYVWRASRLSDYTFKIIFLFKSIGKKRKNNLRKRSGTFCGRALCGWKKVVQFCSQRPDLINIHLLFLIFSEVSHWQRHNMSSTTQNSLRAPIFVVPTHRQTQFNSCIRQTRYTCSVCAVAEQTVHWWRLYLYTTETKCCCFHSCESDSNADPHTILASNTIVKTMTNNSFRLHSLNQSKPVIVWCNGARLRLRNIWDGDRSSPAPTHSCHCDSCKCACWQFKSSTIGQQ